MLSEENSSPSPRGRGWREELVARATQPPPSLPPGLPPAPPHGPEPRPSLVTMVIPVPYSTVTLDTTLVRTSFVTITTYTFPPRPFPPSGFASSSSSAYITPPSSINSEGGITTTTPIAKSRPLQTSLSITTPDAVQHTSPRAIATRAASQSPLTTSQKHAIIGGLSGSIAGLVLIGVLICIFLRRRHRRNSDSVAGSEKGLRSSISRNWSQATSNNTRSRATPPLSRQSSTVDFNGSVIRVSLGGWARPFAHHQSFRESMGPGMLKVTNPDAASVKDKDPSLHRKSVESTYFRRHRPALSSGLFGGSRSRASSLARSLRQAPKVPAVPSISVDPAPSSSASPGLTALPAPTPSFRSYASLSSMRSASGQHPPEDPFLTPPDEGMEDPRPSPAPSPAASMRPRRPGLAVLQNAAGSATKTLSSMGKALTSSPFRSPDKKASADVAAAADDNNEDARTAASRQSTMTFSSNGDPFKLDTRSIADLRGSSASDAARSSPGERQSSTVRGSIPAWRLYEGT